MSFLDGLIHLGNFFLPALGLGLIAAALCKLLWWRALRSVSLWRLARGAVGASAAVLLVGLLLLGQDGRMLTYAAMVAASAGALWWLGLRGA